MRMPAALLPAFLFTAVACAALDTAEAQVIVSTGNAPAGEPTGSDFVQIASKMQHSAALRRNGTLEAWGLNRYGQCSVPPLPAGVLYTKVTTGTNHTVAMRSDGALVSFGKNDVGQGSPPALPPGVTWLDVDASIDWTLGLRSDGRVEVWGGNPLSPVRTQAPTSADFVAIAAGSAHAIALHANGQATAWGASYFGQTWVPTPPSGLAYTAVAAGAPYSVCLRSDGQIVVTGGVGHQLGNLPPLAPGQRWERVHGGPYQLLAWRNDGAVFTSGSAWYYFTPPPPGHDWVGGAWAWDHVHLLAAPHVDASYSLLGPGCAGSLGTSHLTTTRAPALGTTFTCTLDSVPQGLAVLLSGLDATSSPFGALPVNLSFLGMTGCVGYIRTDATQVAVGGSTLAFELAIPYWPGFLGLSFYQQALLFDAVANPAGLVLSDAMTGIVGAY